MALRCKLGLALVASAAASVALLGCSETLSLADLPNISKLPQNLLSKEEQAKTMNQMLEKGQNHEAEAAKEIEGTKVEAVTDAGVKDPGVKNAAVNDPAAKDPAAKDASVKNAVLAK